MSLRDVTEEKAFSKRLCTCPICQKTFVRAELHQYKTKDKEFICSYSCYMKYVRQLQKEFMEKHKEEFK